MLLTRGTIHVPVEGDQRDAVRVWIGPMVDSTFMYRDERV
jgi:hypothetical protein